MSAYLFCMDKDALQMEIKFPVATYRLTSTLPHGHVWYNCVSQGFNLLKSAGAGGSKKFTVLSNVVSLRNLQQKYFHRAVICAFSSEAA